jgi:hypothetical protein
MQQYQRQTTYYVSVAQLFQDCSHKIGAAVIVRVASNAMSPPHEQLVSDAATGDRLRGLDDHERHATGLSAAERSARARDHPVEMDRR